MQKILGTQVTVELLPWLPFVCPSVCSSICNGCNVAKP